jgi:hypothetical protein
MDGLRDLSGESDPTRQVAALKAIPTHGRSVTFILQKLRGQVADFDLWYDPIQRKMRDDPLLRYFHKLRNEVQKEGLPQPVFAVLYEMKASEWVAVADVAIGEDSYGIWLSGAVKSPDIKVMDQSSTILREFQLPGAPKEHLGRSIADSHFENLARLYLTYLEKKVLIPARRQFVTRS